MQFKGSPDNASSSDTAVIAGLINRYNAGDASAREELIALTLERLRRLVSRQLKAFREVHRWEETGDVLQAVLLRLYQALEQVKPANPRQYFALATKKLREQLIDLHRHYQGPWGTGANHHTDGASTDGAKRPLVESASADQRGPADDAHWAEFHEFVETLDPQLREVVDLLWYNELSHEEAAELLGVSTKTVSRRWREARLALGKWLLHGEA
jgi:RNA polymerase sigma-70 factor (ECF subfamily)